MAGLHVDNRLQPCDGREIRPDLHQSESAPVPDATEQIRLHPAQILPEAVKRLSELVLPLLQELRQAPPVEGVDRQPEERAGADGKPHLRPEKEQERQRAFFVGRDRDSYQ